MKRNHVKQDLPIQDI